MPHVRVLVKLLAMTGIMHIGGLYASDLGVGIYVRDGDSGTLIIKNSDDGSLTFQLDSNGVNGHSCSVDGKIKSGIGSDSSEATCHIAFKHITPAKISVEPLTDEECRNFCGMRAHLGGEYVMPPLKCTHRSVQERRNQFIKLYRNHDYKKASEAAKSIIAECEQFIDWVAIDEIRNDLAVSQFHEGNYAACQQTLSATFAASYANEDEVMHHLPPADGDWYGRVAASTFHNKALCSKSTGRK